MSLRSRRFATHKTILGVLLLSAAWAWPAAAQGILPATFGAWTADGPGLQVLPQQAEQLAPDKAAVLREYGITSAERREYTQGERTATVTLYKMVDPSAAFGAFTFLRETPMAPMQVESAVRYSAGSRDRALLVVGNLFFDVSSPKARPADSDLTELASLLAPRADRRPFPLIAEFLPQAGLIQGSERYVLGRQALAQVFPVGAVNQADWIGFDSSAEVIVARYRLAGAPKDQEALLMIAEYPTQQVAADRYGSLGKWLALNLEPGQANGRPLVFGTRSSVLVAVLANVESREVAADLLKQIHYASDVTWNEPTHELTDPSISTIVVGAIVDTGSIMLIALAAGLGFGGFRLLVKVVLPGRVFDRNDQIEILQLGLSSKPIRATDFYQASPDGK
jgi:hypothetical protein